MSTDTISVTVPSIVGDTIAVDSTMMDTVVTASERPLDSVSWKGGYFSNLNPNNEGPVCVGVQVPLRSYTMRNDRVLSSALLVVLVIYLFILARNRHYLKLQLNALFSRRNHSYDYSVKTQKEFRGTLFFQVVDVLVLSLFGFSVLYHLYPHVTTMLDPVRSVVAILGITTCCAFVRRVLYLFVNWIFFDKKKRDRWGDNYNLLISLEGIVLFPSILLLLYSPIQLQYLWILALVLLVFIRFFLMIRSFVIFFGKYYDVLHLILYFCTLEVMPLFVWGVALYELQENWKVII